MLSSFTVKIFVITILFTCNAPISFCCSRSYSKAARNILTEKGFFESIESYDLPKNCPLHPANDVFVVQEDHKFHDPYNKWGCGFCGKFFSSEHFLDLHFDRKHDHERKSGTNVACLADFCDILRCDILSGAVQTTYWELALCVDSKFDTLRERCHKSILDCLDTSLDAKNVETFLNTSDSLLCSDLRCEKYYITNKDSLMDYLYYFFRYLWIFLTCIFICFIYAICCSVTLYQSEMSEREKLKVN